MTKARQRERKLRRSMTWYLEVKPGSLFNKKFKVLVGGVEVAVAGMSVDKVFLARPPAKGADVEILVLP